MKNRTKAAAAKSMIEPLEDRLCMSATAHSGGANMVFCDGSVRFVSSTIQTSGASNLKITDGTSNTLIGLL